MAVDVKFCGLTREEDAAFASEVGATHIGVIFAGGPRHLDAERARAVLEAGGSDTLRVGVMADQSPHEIGRLVEACGLDVIQLHSDPSPRDVRLVRATTAADIWAVVRIRDGAMPDTFVELAALSDAVVLDSHHTLRLGGAGVSFDWRRAASAIEAVRGDVRLVLAGGLTPANVAQAMREIPASIVDVSSGVESAPGQKDHQRMRDFIAAVRQSQLAS